MAIPYRSEKSASPAERQHSISPDPTFVAPVPGQPRSTGPSAPAAGRGGGRGGYGGGDAGPSKRAKLTQSDIQRMHVEKLLANPDKEVALPEPVREKQLRDPHEMMKNVQGSAAGAGSGEFHVYKASRRREYERIQLMEDKGRALEEQEAFQARQEARDSVADAKTAKNRAKRQKRKAGGKGDKKDSTGPSVVVGGAAGGKRKLAGGAEGFAVPRPRDEAGSEDEDEAEAEVERAGVGNLNVPIPSESGAMGETGQTERRAVPVVDEARVVIHDDD